jgi:hypothetical protein
VAERRQKNKEKKLAAAAKRANRKPAELQNPNMIKTANKLIGEIENKDLYNSDDDCGPTLQ